ncbi:FAD-binding oxidoreductase [Auritidibacter ignavus]|uniref:FAD-binding oxidoreductase n=1 Tax=Auritidibacter ignavus TaxID=678932 RepID=UPI000F030099|nr:FAD-linked oxidase C-terminal domain-containing protein [Auritidibacter ignavus]NIH72651.1 glycolate oxidase [Auritidibacter ignavus]RMX22967.1 FAD-binding protein [Auritidibacter ignavus]
MSTTENFSTVLAELRDQLPADAVVDDPRALSVYQYDRSGHLSDTVPSAAVFPRTVEEVQHIARVCFHHRIPMVPRGAGTGLAGSAIGSSGEIMVCTDRMNQILQLQPENRLVTVQPGILNGELNTYLATQGFWWPPDPASKDISTVGGNISMNAGGLLCAKYGVTREAVLSLQVVLADGSLITVGHQTVKGVTGYDLCALLIGSEGTLGIIVEATLKIRPLTPGSTVTLGASFPTVTDAAEAASAVTRHGHTPAMMELLDDLTVALVTEHTGENFGSGNSFLLIQTDGPAAATEAEEIGAILTDHQAELTITNDPEESQRLVGIRRSVFPSLEAKGQLLVEDIAVPRSTMAEAFARIRDLEQSSGIKIPTACHAGDGNLHPVFVVEGQDHGQNREVPEAIWDVAGQVFTMALELGGTLTGEHGVGVLKSRWLPDELGDVQYRLQQNIKAAFDPHNLMNPGKVFRPAPTA